jgi:DNA-binding transcriptional regulator YiaG/uncharacterized phage-associated protein
MKSPVTDAEMKLLTRKEIITFRKEEFEVVYHYYRDEENDLEFTTTELDELNIQQVYNQYREKHRLPFPEEIREIREKYGLPANKMAEILGFGVNIYRNYEQGEVPSESNARLIQMVQDPEEFKRLLKISGVYSGVELLDKLAVIDRLIQQEKPAFLMNVADFLMGKPYPNEFTGFKVPELEKLLQMIVFFTEKIQPWKTKLNKLLFYADFLYFKKTGISMSGATYMAIQMGPVPRNFGGLFDYAASQDYVDVLYYEFDNGIVGEQFKPNPKTNFKTEIFEESEINVLRQVAEQFTKTPTAEIIKISHQEPAWLNNVEGFQSISYKYAFELKSL